MLYTQLTRACMRAAEADAQLDEWGVMTPDPLMVESPRNLFMNAYPRMIEIIQLLGSSSFLIAPDRSRFPRSARRRYRTVSGDRQCQREGRVRLFRLAWDLAGSAFAGRQVLYERFFASDPLTRARAMASIYPEGEVIERVQQFLARDDDNL